MKLFTRLTGIDLTRSAPYTSPWRGVVPPRRDRQDVTTDDAMSLSSVYRAISIITTATSQLPLYVERAGTRLPAAETPSIIKTPNLEMSRGDFVETLVTSLALTGNAYWLARGELRGAPAELVPLNPYYVGVARDAKTGETVYSYENKRYSRQQIGHCKLITLPGALTGLSPIAAARRDLAGAIATRDIATSYFDSTGQPTGILSTEQDLTQDEAEAIISAYNALNPDGTARDPKRNPARVKVLPKGIKYQALTIDPADAQWLETRKFDTTTIARLFGVPASLMLASIEGTSLTYQNIEQEWISFARFTLSQYTRKIEDELTRMTVRGQRVKFNYAGMLRADTMTRYQSYAIALQNSFMTIDEVRALESLGAN